MQIDLINYIKLAKNAFNEAKYDQYLKLSKGISSLIAKLASSGRIDSALALEVRFYNELIKLKETEENYFELMSGHYNYLFEAGREVRFDRDYTFVKGRVAFVAHTSVLLGHTEVMLRVLDGVEDKSNYLFVGLTPIDKRLSDKLKRKGVKYFAPTKIITKPTEQIKWLRSVIVALQIETTVWLSMPCWISYVYGRQIASRQVLWSLKFHPVHLGEDVLHIGMTKGSRMNGNVQFNGKSWVGYNIPLTLDHEYHEIELVKNLRNKYKGIKFGSIAREDKLSDLGYINNVVEILKSNENCCFLYTGRKRPELLSRALSNAELSQRSYFIGWVDTALYSKVIDIYLEPYPFGGGLTAVQALQYGAFVVGRDFQDTLWNHYFNSPQETNDRLTNYRVAINDNEYRDYARQMSIEVDFSARNTKDYEVLQEMDRDKSRCFLNLLRNRID